MLAQRLSLNYCILLVLDAGLILAAHVLAYQTRFEGLIPAEQYRNLGTLIFFFAALKLCCGHFFSLYRGMWRYTSLPDLVNVCKAMTLASLLMMAALLVTNRFWGFSRSVFLLDWLYSILSLCLLRLCIRWLYGLGRPLVFPFLPGFSRPQPTRKKCVLIGAGRIGDRLARELLGNPERTLDIVGVFDDDPKKRGYLLHGLPVIGAVPDLPAWAVGKDVEEALIALPSLTGEGLRRVISACERAGLGYKTIPSLSQVAHGAVTLKALRDVDYKDLLARDPARLDMGRIARHIEGKTVLVTGAGGSIGSELCRQILPFAPGRLLLLDSSEFNLYSLAVELTQEHGFTGHVPLLGDLRSRDFTQSVFASHGPEIVFHAAAYKHVPMLEAHPWQAVTNNVLVTADLVDLAMAHGVERLALVSTDKAVKPASVMGATKRVTEKIMLARCGSKTRLMAVRFGNVLGSAGSVLPLFRRQIERGGPVTVTDPQAVRYFMTVEEACQLILQAASMGLGGEIFVLRMGRPVRIEDMARDLIRLSGKIPDTDIRIEFTGLRPGEKLSEELTAEGEIESPTEHEQIMAVRGQSCDAAALDAGIEILRQAAAAMDERAIRKALQDLVPDYSPWPGPTPE